MRSVACLPAIALLLLGGCVPESGPRDCPDGGCEPDAAVSVDPLQACLAWQRVVCDKLNACIPDENPCDDTDADLLADCRESFAESECAAPDPASFDTCYARESSESCEEFCPDDASFCGGFCFFRCLD